MSSMRARVRPSRLVAVAVIALATIPLSGCLFGSIPSETPTEAPTSAPAPTPEGSDEAEGTAPATLSFDDGALLSDSVYIEWGDGLMTDDG